MQPTYYRVGKYGTLVYLATARFKTDLLSVHFAVPIKEETAQQNALAFSLPQRGTVQYPTLAALNRRLDYLYSTGISVGNRRLGDMQSLSLTADFLGAKYVEGGKGILAEVVEMLAELLTRPLVDEKGVFTSEYVAREKQQLAAAIRSAKNSPRDCAAICYRELLYAGEPHALSLSGKEETLAANTPEALWARHGALLTETAPVFCYVGSTPAAEVLSLLEGKFATLGAAPAPYRSALRPAGEVREAEVTRACTQSIVKLGFRADIAENDPLLPALSVFNELFGGSPASRLFLNVREKQGLCYRCSSALQKRKSTVTATAAVKEKNITVAKEAMLGEFSALQNGNFTARELQIAKDALLNTYRSAFDYPGSFSKFYVSGFLSGSDTTLGEEKEKIARVTADDVLAAGKRLALDAVFCLRGEVKE